MTRSIWKYTLEVTDDQIIKMPKWSKPLCVQTQNGTPQIWVEVDPSMEEYKGRRRFITVGTGEPLPDYESYIGTYQLLGGDLVFHVFEVSVLQ